MGPKFESDDQYDESVSDREAELLGTGRALPALQTASQVEPAVELMCNVRCAKGFSQTELYSQQVLPWQIPPPGRLPLRLPVSTAKPSPGVFIGCTTTDPFTDSAAPPQYGRMSVHYLSQSSSSSQIGRTASTRKNGRSSSSSSFPQASVTRSASARRPAFDYSNADRASSASQTPVESFSLPAGDRHSQDGVGTITYDSVHTITNALFNSIIGKKN